MEAEISNANNLEFAMPLNITFGIVKKDSDGAINLLNSDEGVEGIRNALVVEKPVSSEKSHPYRETIAINVLFEKLQHYFSASDLPSYIPCRDRKTGLPKITDHCFQSMLFKVKCKSSNNTYHYAENDPKRHRYSEALVDLLFEKITNDAAFITHAKQGYQASMGKK